VAQLGGDDKAGASGAYSESGNSAVNQHCDASRQHEDRYGHDGP